MPVQGASARKYAISLKNIAYSGDLADQMMQFSKKMETVYQKLQDLVSREVKSESAFKKYFVILDDKMQWYEKAEARSSKNHVGYVAWPFKYSTY